MHHAITTSSLECSIPCYINDGRFAGFLPISLSPAGLYRPYLSDRLTRMGLLSLKYLRISPIIMGTAYVENFTF